MAPILALQSPQEGDQGLLLVVREPGLQHQVEELDGVLEREQPAVVVVGRGVLDPPEREGMEQVRRALLFALGS
jgi:hypothetical protein